MSISVSKLFDFLRPNLQKVVHRQQLYPSQHIVRPWPINLQEQDRTFFAINREFKLPPSWLLRLGEVSMYWDGLTFHGLRVYRETLVLPDRPEHNWRGALSMYLRLPSQRLAAGRRYLLVHDAWASAYYHWMVDTLPRLWAIRDQLSSLVLVLPEKCRMPYHQEILAALGVKEIEWLREYIRYVVPDLLVPTRLARVASYNPQVMRELRQFLLAAFPLLPHANLGERIYISRAKAPRRKVLNEEAVVACLHYYKFVVVQLEDYSFAEQASIMARAQVLVSIHGAGLTNMLFMPVGSKVLELQMQDDGTNHYYYTLAADLAIDYYYQFCEPSDPAKGVQDADLTVDTQVLTSIVEQMIHP